MSQSPSAPAAKRQSVAATRVQRGIIAACWSLAGIAIVMIIWELIKWIGTKVTLPFDSSGDAMPHVWDIATAFGQPEVRGSDTTVWQAVLSAVLHSLVVAAGGFIIGVAVGLILAIVMQRFGFFERGLLPFVIASQTVPLIALAPLIVGLGNQITIGSFSWTTTYSVMFISAYLAFFPLSIGALRGLQSPSPTMLELMRSYGASPMQTLFKLRFPSSTPYLVPALKVSVASAIVGAVVAEISTGVAGGIGRTIIEYARESSETPTKVYVAVIGALILGLLASGLVTLLDMYLTRNLPKEATA